MITSLQAIELIVRSFIFLQLNQDCQELQKLLKIATRSNVRQLIAAEITLLQGKLHKLQEEHKREGNDKNEGATNGEQAPKEEKPQTKHLFTKKIESYGLYTDVPLKIEKFQQSSLQDEITEGLRPLKNH